MKKQSYCLVFISLLALPLAVTLAGCGGGAPSSGTPSTPRGAGDRAGRSGGPGDRSGQARLAPLGITGQPSGTQPQGLRVTGFTSSTEPSPLEVIGVKEGDVIVGCNGGQEQMAGRCLAAIEGLQERGEPITLTVIRDGQQIELKRTERIPDAPTSEAPE
jgi:S1-C subfamily serine protease